MPKKGRHRQNRRLSIRMRNGNTFKSSDNAWMLAALKSLAFLTKENVSILEKHEYMVAPMADGQRALLLCEQNTFDVYLIHPHQTPSRLIGRYVGPRQKSTGFLIDAEVIKIGMNTSWILAFDVLSMEGDIRLDGKTYNAWDLHLGDSVPPLEKRHELLVALVENLTVQGLFVKPLMPAQEAFQVKKSLQSLPYKTDGLIFTPRIHALYLPTLKWKPPSNLSVDVAIGGPLVRGNSTSCFIAYLDAEDTFSRMSPVTTVSRVVPPSHLPFCMSDYYDDIDEHHAPHEKQIFLITDKLGNPIGFSKGKSSPGRLMPITMSQQEAERRTAEAKVNGSVRGGEREGAGGGRGGQAPQSNRDGQDYYDDIDDDYAPLVCSENHWKPSKDDSVMTKIDKQIKSLLNKMTKEKIDKLSTKMRDIPIQSYEMLTLVIKLVYEKAISEPSFSDMYANLCYRLSQMVKKGTFIKIIESDEDPSPPYRWVSYRWSNDVSTSDAEIVGPFEDEQQSIDAALADEDATPVKRGEMKLTLHRLLIRRGTFIKIMHSQSDSKYYIVFFPIAQADECGQQLSLEIFTTNFKAQNDAIKMNSFKRNLLKKCADEFNKRDVYTDWKVEKKDYEKTKTTVTEKERAEKEEELEFRRMKIKKQILGNIKFIGELYKLGMLKVKFMRFCIHSLLKIEEHDGSLRTQTGEDGEMDEEDHEALCNLLKTIGDTIDKTKDQRYMMVYFSKIEKLSDNKALSSRLRFMYKDLIEMRSKGWKLSKSKGSVIRCLTEEEGYYFAGFTCDQNCPCEKHDFDILSKRMMRLSHCLNCSSLGISLPSSPFTCQIACVNSGRYHSSHKCFSVDIPNDVADWCKHGIVEVMYEGTTSLKFIRIRRDRKNANSESVANTILKSVILSPIDISSIHFKSSAKSAVKYQSKNTHYRRSIDTDTIDRCSLSEFKNLRVHHLRIKGWLYRAFGGRRIIDACVGGLTDIQNWLDAGFTFVLAIDRDEGQLNTARSRLDDYGTANKLREIQISIVEGDLSLPIDLCGGPFETVFCNFAIHYFWNTRETIKCFLNNLASVLDNNGRFVITYLRGEELVRERSIKIYSKSGKLEFSADMIEEGSHLAEISVASIGIPHRESVMVLDDMISCFKEAGFNYVTLIPFETFASILPSGSFLSTKELDMSSLYSAAVFEKWLPCQEQNSFFPIRYPPNLEYEALSYLDIPDLVKGRRVCNCWKTVIDHHVQIPSQTKVAFFNQHIVEYDPIHDQYVTKMGKVVSPPALAMFLRWGGRVSTKEGRISTDSRVDDLSDFGVDDLSDVDYYGYNY